MKRCTYILAALAAFLFVLSSCVKVDHTDEYMLPTEMVDENAVYNLALYHVYEYDPMNTAGIELVDEFDFFKSYRFRIYHENSKVAAVEIDSEFPFSTYGFPIPAGKHEAYFNTTSVPYTIRLKENDQVVATWLAGEYCIKWQLGCEEISYKLTFKKAND